MNDSIPDDISDSLGLYTIVLSNYLASCFVQNLSKRKRFTRLVARGMRLLAKKQTAFKRLDERDREDSITNLSVIAVKSLTTQSSRL